MPPGSASAWMRAARLTPSPKMFWSSSSTMTSPRCTPMRKFMRCSGSIVSLNFAMRSWMSSAALTAVTAEPNSASMASPAVPTRRPLAAWMAGRQTSICAVLRCRKVRVSEPSIMRVKPAMSAWTMAARRRCMIGSAALEAGGRRSRSAARPSRRSSDVAHSRMFWRIAGTSGSAWAYCSMARFMFTMESGAKVASRLDISSILPLNSLRSTSQSR